MSDRAARISAADSDAVDPQKLLAIAKGSDAEAFCAGAEVSSAAGSIEEVEASMQVHDTHGMRRATAVGGEKEATGTEAEKVGKEAESSPVAGSTHGFSTSENIVSDVSSQLESAHADTEDRRILNAGSVNAGDAAACNLSLPASGAETLASALPTLTASGSVSDAPDMLDTPTHVAVDSEPDEAIDAGKLRANSKTDHMSIPAAADTESLATAVPACTAPVSGDDVPDALDAPHAVAVDADQDKASDAERLRQHHAMLSGVASKRCRTV